MSTKVDSILDHVNTNCVSETTRTTREGTGNSSETTARIAYTKDENVPTARKSSSLSYPDVNDDNKKVVEFHSAETTGQIQFDIENSKDEKLAPPVSTAKGILRKEAKYSTAETTTSRSTTDNTII
jgi:hypothetical protein